MRILCSNIQKEDLPHFDVHALYLSLFPDIYLKCTNRDMAVSVWPARIIVFSTPLHELCVCAPN